MKSYRNAENTGRRENVFFSFVTLEKAYQNNNKII